MSRYETLPAIVPFSFSALKDMLKPDRFRNDFQGSIGLCRFRNTEKSSLGEIICNAHDIKVIAGNSSNSCTMTMNRLIFNPSGWLSV